MSSPSPPPREWDDDFSKMIFSYHYHRLDFSVICFPKSRPLEINQHMVQSSLGHLDKFPAEITWAILNHLDFQSLGAVRSANKRGKSVVEGLPAYRDAVTHAHGVLRTMAGVELLSEITASELHSVLHSYKCACCENFGTCIYHPTFTRACDNCINHLDQLKLITAVSAKKGFGLTEKDLREIHVVKTIPGVYWISGMVHEKRRLKVVSKLAAYELSSRKHGGTRGIAEYTLKKGFDRRRCHEIITLGTVVIRERAYIACPYLNLSTHGVEFGVRCFGCRFEQYQQLKKAIHDEHILKLRIIISRVYPDSEKPEKIFTGGGFMAHFKLCKPDQDLMLEFLDLYAGEKEMHEMTALNKDLRKLLCS